MTEFWVSQAKYYCKFCKCYMADNKANRQHHESSIKHKQNVDFILKQKRQEKLHGAQSEADLKRQLADIEKAALAAMAADNANQFPPPPPPQYPPGAFSQSGNMGLPPKALANMQEEALPKEENTGIYSIRGVTYLDGSIFVDKLRTGESCEVFVETLDDWFPGEILKRTETNVPNTTIVLYSFDVKYTIPSGEVGIKDTTTEEKGIKSDRIRIKLKEGEDPVSSAPAASSSLPSLPAPTVINEDTGIGMWQTVVVREVDEVKEKELFEEARKSMVDDMNNRSKILMEPFAESKGSQTSASNSHNQFVKEYKGHKIDDLVGPNINKLLEDGVVVQFKKRKLVTEEPSGIEVAESKVDEGSAAEPPSKPFVKKASSRPQNIRKRLEED